MSAQIVGIKVECYAGYKGDETPRSLDFAGQRVGVDRVLSRERVLDPASGLRRDVWRCRLDDGRVMILELLVNGTWRVSPAR